MHYFIIWNASVCFAGSTLCDRGTSLSQFWGLLHGAGSHHRSGGQSQDTVDFPRCQAVCCLLLLLIVYVNSSRHVLCHWWSFPTWANCPEAGRLSCGITFWQMSRGWANTHTTLQNNTAPCNTILKDCLRGCFLEYSWTVAHYVRGVQKHPLPSSHHFLIIHRTWRSLVTHLGLHGVSSLRSSAGSSLPLLVKASTKSSSPCWEKSFLVCLPISKYMGWLKHKKTHGWVFESFT